MKIIYIFVMVSCLTLNPAFAQTMESVLGSFDAKDLKMYPERARFSFFVLGQFDTLRSRFLEIREELSSVDKSKLDRKSISNSIMMIYKRNSDVCVVIKKLSRSEQLSDEARDAAGALFKLESILTSFQPILLTDLNNRSQADFRDQMNKIISKIERDNPDFVSGKIRVSDQGKIK